MSDEELDYWIEYGSNIDPEQQPLSGGYSLGGDVLKLWELVAELGKRIRSLEDADE